jgi:hypothetical protein
VSTGLCPGCDQCREAFSEYVPVERYDDCDPAGPEHWTVPALDGEEYATEDAALIAAREAFKDAWSDGVVNSEASFSWSPCDICGGLPGDREEYHYVIDGKLYHDSGACPDCVVYLANGDVPSLPDGALEKHRDEDGNLPSFVWPGGYPILYVLGDGESLCPDCANGANGSEASDDPDKQTDWRIEGLSVFYEGAPEYCAHCGKTMESAYGDPEAEQTEQTEQTEETTP